MDARIVKWKATHLGIRIPRSRILDMKFPLEQHELSFVRQETEGKDLTYKKDAHLQENVFEQMMSSITLDTVHDETEVEGPIGRELW